jgi:GTP pyrophosphokinase
MGQDPASEPSREWLEHARTPTARIAIQRWLTAHPASDGPDGPATDPTAAGTASRPTAGAPARPAGDSPADGAARPAAPAPAAPGGTPARRATTVVDLPDATVRLAGCCTPVPPDEATGFLVRGGVVTVHRVECSAVAHMKAAGRAEVLVRWGDATEARVTLVAESFGRPHLLADLTEAIAVEDVAIVSATVESPNQQRVRHTYTLRLPDSSRLPALMRAMRDVPGVYDVRRAQPHAPAG